ncbi:MAG: GGDEF domain-containing protein [Clostridia bacterium]|nr:GGDEF domain-containing protein [Clostridia bacterium]
MSVVDKVKREGVSLRLIHIVLVALAVLISGFLVFGTIRFWNTFTEFTAATEEYVELHQGAKELMDASDYLTEKVQRFTLDGNMTYLVDYFTEAFETKTREAALDKMKQYPDGKTALTRLQKAMDGSLKLMQREYYAMKLVLEAHEINEYPVELDDITLTAEHQALPADDKLRLAQSMVMDEIYYLQKDRIRVDMQESLDAIDDLIEDSREAAKTHVLEELGLILVFIVLEAAAILGMILLTSKLGIHPVLKAVDNIKEENPIPVIGANEFRYLARTYNRMYEVYKKSIDSLNYKASHDGLTGVYNRAGYDLLMSSIGLSTTYLLIIDVDHFKQVNDTCGHKIGDEALQRVAGLLKQFFRADDYVCRIGGDEFVVLMVHATTE